MRSKTRSPIRQMANDSDPAVLGVARTIALACRRTYNQVDVVTTCYQRGSQSVKAGASTCPTRLLDSTPVIVTLTHMRIPYLMRPAGWIPLRGLGNSRLIATSYFWFLVVPVAVELLLPIAGDYEYNPPWLNRPVHIVVDLPFTWYLFYGAAISFVFAKLVYLTKCPRVVRDLENYGEYIATHVGLRVLLSYIEILIPQFDVAQRTELLEHAARDSLDRWGPRLKDAAKRAIDTDHAIDILKGATQRSDSELFASTVFLHLRVCASSLHPNSQRVCMLLFTVGLGLMSIVVVQNFLSVIRLIFK